MDDYVRQCALPGCDAPIDDIPGRPARRYCTAAHRAAARQARRASMQPDQQDRLAETLPWLREPDPEPVLVRSAGAHAEPVRVPAPRLAPPERRSLAARLGDHLPRRRRAIAVIGAAGILAGGYAVTSSQTTEIAGPTQETPQGETTDGWAARAQVTLTSVDRQLDTIAQTEAAWNAMPEHTAVGTPVPVAELMNRKALLERRKAALQSQLDSYRALARTKADLELSEQNLDAVEKALRNTPTTGVVTSPDEATALAALQEQRDLRIRQRDAKKLELAGIEGNVEKAARAPLPDDGQQTAAVSAKVMDVIHNGGRDGGLPTTPAGPRRPEVLASGREGEQAQERQATTTSAPPDPRGPRDESAERRPQAAAAPKGPVGKVGDTVDGVLGGGPADPQTGEQRRGPVGKVADTVGDVLDGGRQQVRPVADVQPLVEEPAEEPTGPVGKVVDTVGGAVEGLTGGNSEKESAPKKSAPQESKPKQAPKAAESDGSAQARSTPVEAPAPSGGDDSGAMPGAELAMAIVRSVPGGEAAAPAVEAALRRAAEDYAEQYAAQYAEQANAPTTTEKSSKTTVVDDSGSPQEKSSDTSGWEEPSSRSGSDSGDSTSGDSTRWEADSWESGTTDSGGWESDTTDSGSWESDSQDSSSWESASSDSNGSDSNGSDSNSWDPGGSGSDSDSSSDWSGSDSSADQSSSSEWSK